MKISARQLQNGTKCYIIYKKDWKMKEAMFSVNFGSADDSVIPGTAHLLEHKVFEQKDMDVFKEFSSKNASVNAFTNFNTTAYYFICSDFFEENLKTLLKFTAEPFFTDESIEREKSIISEEIKMYEDDPWWQVYFNLIGALYSQNPVRNNIAGSIGDINRIDRSILTECYKKYYCGENSALVICGDLDADKTFDMAERLILPEQGEKYEKKKFSDGIESHRTVKKMAVSRPIFNLGFRESDFDTSPAERVCATNILLNIMFGKSSDFYEKMYLSGAIDKDFSMEYLLGEGFGAGILSGASDSPDNVAQAVYDRIAYIRKNGISDYEIEGSRKQLLRSFFLGLDIMEKVVAGQTDFAFKKTSYEDIYNKYIGITKKEVMNRLDIFDRDDSALSVIEPA